MQKTKQLTVRIGALSKKCTHAPSSQWPHSTEFRTSSDHQHLLGAHGTAKAQVKGRPRKGCPPSLPSGSSCPVELKTRLLRTETWGEGGRVWSGADSAMGVKTGPSMSLAEQLLLWGREPISRAVVRCHSPCPPQKMLEDRSDVMLTRGQTLS